MANQTREPILCVRDLKVHFRTQSGEMLAVRDFNLDVARGETVGVVGESGSGKSQAMLACMGLLAANGSATGSARFDGVELVGAPVRVLNQIRGNRLTIVFQEPMSSLDPLRSVGRQIAAPMRHHRGLSAGQARARAIELLSEVRIPEPERRIDAYPHELSGGQRQRVMIAMALANEPELLIADEPTTALDVTVAADRVLVMRQGEVVEQGEVGQLLACPRHPYTRMLVEAVPRGSKAAPQEDAPVVLEACNIGVTFTSGLLGRQRFSAVEDVSLAVRQGETLGIVGESGSGKTTLARALIGLVPARGEVTFLGRSIGGLSRGELRPLRRHMQIVYQDPQASLSPRLTAGEIVTEGLLVHEPGMTWRARDKRAAQAFEEVGLDSATRNRFPHAFSGGQRQRIAIARAMILKPRLVVLDEPTSALDRSVQADIVMLLRHLQHVHGVAYLFISHDLSVVAAMCDRVLVMKDGRVVEEGSVGDIMERPRAEYSRALMRAAFSAGPGRARGP